MKFKDIYNTILAYCSVVVGKIHWKGKKELTVDQQAVIREMLVNDYYIILTRRNNHLSTYAISVVDFIKTGKFGTYSHILMNTEDEVKSDSDFRLVEAIGSGVQYTPFENVFDVNSVALIKPRGMTIEQWTIMLDEVKNFIGLPYDTVFDILDRQKMSCVELVRSVLMTLPDYNARFAVFEKMITDNHILTPDMFYNCSDFEIVFEIR